MSDLFISGLVTVFGVFSLPEKILLMPIYSKLFSESVMEFIERGLIQVFDKSIN